MNRSMVLLLALPFASIACAAPIDEDTSSSEDAQTEGRTQANQVKLVNDVPGRVLQLFTKDGEQKSGGIGFGQTATFSKPAFGSYVVKSMNDTGNDVKDIVTIDIDASTVDANHDLDILCTVTGSTERCDLGGTPAARPPAPAGAQATPVDVRLTLRYYGLDKEKLYVYAQKDASGAIDWSSGYINAETRINNQRHTIKGDGTGIGLKIWDIDNSGRVIADGWIRAAAGQPDFVIPQDARFGNSLMSCWKTSNASGDGKVGCSLVGLDEAGNASVYTFGDGRVYAVKR